MVAREMGGYAASAGQKSWAMVGVVFTPDFVGGVPFGSREIRGAINVVPVRGVVLLEFGEVPGDFHFTEHGEVGGGIGGVGGEEWCVPLEEEAVGRWLG